MLEDRDSGLSFLINASSSLAALLLPETFKENVRNILFNDKHISLLMKESSSELVAEVQDEIDEELDFILDNSLVITDKIHQYINKKYESDMSLEELTKYINEEFKIE